MRSEFDFIHHIKDKYALKYVGDDCAVLPKDDKTDLVVTADMLVEDIDFRLDWTTPELLGAKALAISLSDIAAMGGIPKWAMLTIGVPREIWDSDFVDRFYRGWFTVAKHHGVELVGGDVSRVPDKVVIDSIIGGETKRGQAILRSTAKPGDSIYVSGCLGGAAGGLMLLQAGERYKDSNPERKELITRQIRPQARVELGRFLRTEKIATSCIDLSDGLSSDLKHICDASGVGAHIFADRIPVDPNLAGLSLADESRFAMALNGGEDFELLFTADNEKEFWSNPGEITLIGEITSNVGIIEVISEHGSWIAPPKGHRHF